MAEQITHDVVKEAQSMGGPSPIDDPATTTNNSAGDGEAPSDPKTAKSKHSEAFPTSTNATSTDAAQVDGIRASEKAGGDAMTASTADSSTQQQPDVAPKETKEQLVNGDSGEQSASEDVTSQQAVGDASGGSDTDISRPGSVDQAKERASGHVRSNSMKKPASFKSVSVTKNFLAKSAVSTPPVRPGEKAAPAGQTNASLQQTAKPRLVAKSGSGIGNVPRSSLSKMNGTGSGPDASKVWNKNQPVPPPPPKQFTDEELKQQYGIHLATRLQADEGGKEAKWADIDDDEDDWAPDTVQWMDGTKSTVAAVENQPPPPEDPKPIAKKEIAIEAARPAPTPVVNSPRPSSTSGTKTILKPGALSQGGSSKSGLVLKGQTEKPTLVAKPSATSAVKSPWAPLPPVDKVSPLHVNPPTQQPAPPRFSQQDSRGYDTMPPPSAPAKEIAPDDFNRSWRDDRGNRELFNSHSGRYEPVNEMRRGSVRENNFRQQPSVLQRPSHDGPAEPSAAFQTSRTSADGPTWGRRRNSSNVSGGSGRRMSIDRRAPDIPHMPMNIQRRGSQSVNGTDAAAPGTPRQAFAQKALVSDLHHSLSEQHPSPSLSNAQPVSPFGSVGSSGTQDAAAPSAPVQLENVVEVQKRLMSEKLERARLAKQKEREQEAKEKAEREERLRKKLEAMGLSDDSKSKSKDLPQSRATGQSPQKERAVLAHVQSPPKPPVPTSEGEVAQYGMMKVHQPHPVKKSYHPDLAATKTIRGVESAPKPTSSPVKAQPEVQPKSAPPVNQPPPQPLNNFTRENDKNKSQLEQSQAHVQQSDGAGPQGLKSTQPPPAAWSPSLPQQQQPRPWASNVWGPPQTKDRALGNGTFDSGYNRGQPRPAPQQLASQPQPGQATPIGLNPPLKPSPAQPQVTPNQAFTQQTMYAQTGTGPVQQTNAAPKPGPIAPPPAKGWGNFAAAIRRDDQDMVIKARQDLERIGGETFRPEILETYTDQQGKSQKTLHSKIGGNAVSAEGPTKTAAPELKSKDEVGKLAIDGLSAQPAVTPGHLQPATQAARPSRFFPRPSETATQSSTTSNKSDSPPPPETGSHPAFTGDSTHPVVRMPKPPPRVRLPPAAVAESVPSETSVSMHSRARVVIGARPLALDPEWQARFNSLLDKSPAAVPPPIAKFPSTVASTAHAKPGSLAIAVSSKAPLEVRENVAGATVSLPNTVTRKIFADDNSSEVITRASAEGILLEEREFGSLPIVKFSKVPHLAANEPPVAFPTNRPNSRFQRPLDIVTKPTLNVLDIDHSADSIDVIIRFTNMREAITKAVPKKRGVRKSSGHNNKAKRNFTPNSATPGSGPNQRPRKASNYPGQGPNSSNSPRSSGGSGWTNARSTPPHNNSPWTRRATPSAPVH